ncbi:MAG: diphosphomevalonate decarboxylase [Anaerolineaceae bacterium]|nr:diphosphomevalonate decarboxylase [Anaerolineaceae bacterium]
MQLATALAHPNIAFIKYWGNRDHALRIPQNGSISMNLSGLETRTAVHFDPKLTADRFTLNGKAQTGPALARVSAFLNHVRSLAGLSSFAQVNSTNNFPLGAGIASSASAFAALALASSSAAGLNLSEHELSCLARLGSGSAARSVPAGFVEWQPGTGHTDSYAFSIASPKHWEIQDLIVVVDALEKQTGSTEGHALAATSPLNPLRQAGLAERLKHCRQAILAKDFCAFAEVVEADSNWMHAVMRTSTPPLYYWRPLTEVLLHYVAEWRSQGHALCATVDAGPNVHILALQEEIPWLKASLAGFEGIRELLLACPAEAASLIETPTGFFYP